MANLTARIIDIFREEKLTIREAKMVLKQTECTLELERLVPKGNLPVQEQCTGSGEISASEPDHCRFSTSDSESEDTGSESHR